MALSTRSNSLINSRRLAVLLASTALVASPALATNYPVTDTASASSAVTSANAAPGADSLTLQNSITLTSALPSIVDSLGVNGAGFTLGSATGNVIFQVGGAGVDLAIGNDVTINGGNNQAIQVGGTNSIVENLGTVRNSGTGAAGSLGAAIIVAAPSGTTSIANGSASDSVATVAGLNYGVINRFGNAGALSINNYGAISGNSIGVLGENSAGIVTVINQSGGSIGGANSGLQLAGAASVTNSGSITGGTGQFQRGVYFTGSGSTLTNLAGGTITAGRAIQVTGAGSVYNAGTLTSDCASPSFQCGAVVTFAGGTVTNAAGGQIISSSRGVIGQGAATNVINDGSIVSTLAGDAAVILFTGGTIANNAGGSIANANGYAAYLFATSGSIINAGAISGQFGASIDSTSGTISNSGTISGTDTGVSGFNNATVGLTNSGQVSGASFGVRSFGGSLSVTNLDGGTISSANGVGIYTDSGALNVDNQAGATVSANSHAIRSGAAATVTNAGTLTSANADAVWSGGPLTLANSGTINGGFAGITATAGGAIVNSGAINGSASPSGFSYAVQFTGAGTITNQAGGALNGADGAIATFGSGAITIDLQAGSSANGAIVSTGDGLRTLTVDGTLAGAYDASAGTGADTVTLGQSGAIGGASLGDGDDSFTTFGGSLNGPLDGGAGSDILTADLADAIATGIDLGSVSGFETIAKLGLGTLTLSGLSASPDALILAGNGGNDDGLLTFTGTDNLTGNIVVNGAVIRADTVGAFGSGTITTIDPTIQYGATGTYSNNIVLAVPGDASLDPTRLEAINGSTAVLTGSITQDPSVGDQYVTIGGDGTILLANNANTWAGVTAIDGGATLQGASDTISGSAIADNGRVNYVQAYGGTVSQDISGGGRVGVSGLAAGQALTFAGNLTNDGIDLTDGSHIVLSGTSTTGGNGVFVTGSDAIVDISSGASLTSNGGPAIASVAANTTVNNLGAIAGYNGNPVGVGLYAGGTINNGSATDSTASIIGGNTGSNNGGTVTLNNYGLVQGNLFNGIDGDALTVNNFAGGQIIGNGYAGPGAGYGVIGNAVTLDNSGQIVGRQAGVTAFGTLALTNAGLIGSGWLSGTSFSYSDGNDGIQVLGGGSIANLAGGQVLGSISGIYAANALVTVDNAGTIHGNQYGVYADAPVTLSNASTGAIDGASFGILLNRNGNLLTNAGTINGSVGIQSSGTVSLTNLAGGTVGGSSAAFDLVGTGAATVTNFGDFTNGVVSTGGGNLTVDNRASGNIVRVPFGSAIDMSNGGRLTLTNAGDIVGSGWGVVGRNAGDSITNSGRVASGTISGETITAGGANAIELQQGGTVTNLAGGQISGGNAGITGAGILVDNQAGASISGRLAVSIANGGRVTNAGTISGGTANGKIGVQLNNNGSLTNLAGGTIIGARATQFSGANAVLTNSGTIASNAATPSQGYGAFFINGGAVSNLAGGIITASYRGVSIQGGVGTITNAGTIRSTTDVAAVLFNGGTITNQAGGLIDGHYRGAVILGASGTVTNSGTISAVVDNGVSLFNGGTVTNNGTGSIVADGAGGWGIYGTGGTLNISNAGSIHADSGIVTNANGAVVTNSGTIVGAVDGVNNLAATSLSLANSGTITATNRTAVRAEGALVLTNNGTIRSNSASTADGVTVLNGAAATISNAGTISAATASGVAVTGASTITNSGTLAGGTDATYGYGMQFAAGSSGSLVNASGGTLSGGAGSVLVNTGNAVAIDLQQGSTANGAILSLGSGARSLTVSGALNGSYNASAATGADTLMLAASGSIGSVDLGAGADSFTTRGGTIGGTVNGGADSDSLTFDIAGSASYDAGLFVGFESRSNTGVGTLTLTGSDGQTADFALNGGTLVLSGGAALNDGAALVTAAGTTTRLADANEQVRTISGAGAIDLGAYALILGGNDSSAYSGVIGGSGSLAKFGTGTLTLSGANAFTGLTQVSAGVLSLGASNVIADTSIVLVATGATFDLAGFNETIGGLTGAGTVSLGAGRLTVNQSLNTLFSGPITGTGGLTKAGGGTLNLSGASSYTGSTLVNGGTLAVNGSLASAVTVNSGGTLGGNGSVGATSILAGGTLAPSNSIGHLTVNGNLSFAAGSIYQVETTPAAADSTSVTGNIAIAGGTVQVLATGAAYNPLTRYTILDSVGTVSGAFAGITSNLAFLTPGLEYNPRSVVLVLRRNDIIFSAVAANPDQVAVANALQSIGISPLYDAVLVQSAVGARQAYDALSGEVYASSETAILAQRDRLQSAMASNRLRTDGMSLWLDAGKSWGTSDFSPRGNAPASTNTDDLLGGFNWARGSLGLTIAGGRVIDKVEIEDRSSRAKARSWLFGGQLAYGADLGMHAAAGGNYASHRVSTDRAIAFPGFADTASSSRNGSGYHLFGQLGYASQTAGIVLEPFVGIARDHLKLDAVSEAGGLAALDIRAASRSLTTTQLGLKLASSANLGWAVFTPRTSIAWQHVISDRTGKMNAGFHAGGLDYALTGTSLARDSAKVGVDLDFNLGGATVVAGYSGTLAGIASDHTAKVAVQVRF